MKPTVGAFRVNKPTHPEKGHYRLCYYPYPWGVGPSLTWDEAIKELETQGSMEEEEARCLLREAFTSGHAARERTLVAGE